MSIDAIDLESAFNLNQWIESDEAGKIQRELEEKITQIKMEMWLIKDL